MKCFWLHATLPRWSSGFDSRHPHMITEKKVQTLVVLRRERTLEVKDNHLLVKVDLRKSVSASG